MDQEVHDVNLFCQDVKQEMSVMAEDLEEMRKDRAAGFPRVEELQRLQSDKDAEMESIRSKGEQLLAQFREAAAERDRLNEQLAGSWNIRCHLIFGSLSFELTLKFSFSFLQRRHPQ